MAEAAAVPMTPDKEDVDVTRSSSSSLSCLLKDEGGGSGGEGRLRRLRSVITLVPSNANQGHREKTHVTKKTTSTADTTQLGTLSVAVCYRWRW